MSNLVPLTILHSNDMHGDFLAEDLDENLVGGVSLLSGYVNKVRNENENVIYTISGDMFRGSIIDSEFKGISTVDIMNMLSPDVVSLGNHEMDYGIAHLLFLEKCTKFPIINSNLYIKTNGTRLFNSHQILKVGGMSILFIGILTEEIMANAKGDTLIGTFINVNEAAQEVGKICNIYKSVDIDLTVLLTHIGFERDKQLAQSLDKAWGVDLIIGGHSHTILEKPVKVNDILITQAGMGTDQVGRFDILVDMDTNSVDSYKWQLIPINEDTCPKDEMMSNLIKTYKEETDKKYKRLITRLKRRLTHPIRNEETELGNLFADIFASSLGVDIVFLGSGSIRKPYLGPVVEYGDLTEIFPYDDSLHMIKVTGEQLKRMVKYVLRDDAYTNETEFYQINSDLRIDYSYKSKEILSLTFKGKSVEDTDIFKVVLQAFHFNNFTGFFGVPIEEIIKNGAEKTVSTSCFEILEEDLSQSHLADARVEGRITISDRPDR
ncbi:MAG: bifunctional metallophosphatase/5'-nucleotidase [Eubacteriaceae bacterium]|nr:bifunctional metallophosphatase/5'-nucleotidase [Eubacteriaceae bacterium]